MSRDKKDVKSINVPQVVSYLNHTFAKAAEEVFGFRPANARGTPLYGFQVEHCYLIDEIQRGPTYMLPKIISDANNNIAAMRELEQNVT
jgi:hypothetical protein